MTATHRSLYLIGVSLGDWAVLHSVQSIHNLIFAQTEDALLVSGFILEFRGDDIIDRVNHNAPGRGITLSALSWGDATNKWAGETKNAQRS